MTHPKNINGIWFHSIVGLLAFALDNMYGPKTAPIRNARGVLNFRNLDSTLTPPLRGATRSGASFFSGLVR